MSREIMETNMWGHYLIISYNQAVVYLSYQWLMKHTSGYWHHSFLYFKSSEEDHMPGCYDMEVWFKS